MAEQHNTNLEIERKYLVKNLPENLEAYPHQEYAQGYLSVNPVVRVRKEGETYVLTYKGQGMISREEYNLPLTKESYEHLLKKADGIIIEKTRYRIPLGGLTAELDVFHGTYEGLLLVEVEFSSLEESGFFTAPEWFGEDVSENPRYHNSYLALHQPEKR